MVRLCLCEGFAGRLLAKPRVVIVATHADAAASVTDERRSVTDTSSAVVETVALKFADDFDVVQRLFAINCQRPTYTELKALRLCLAEIRTSIVSVSPTTKPDVQMCHDTSCRPIRFGVKRSKVVHLFALKLSTVLSHESVFLLLTTIAEIKKYYEISL